MALYAPAPEAKGWLWRQLGPSGGGAWCKLWAVLRGGTLEFFTNSQAGGPRVGAAPALAAGPRRAARGAKARAPAARG